jgi:hypothetical protein
MPLRQNGIESLVECPLKVGGFLLSDLTLQKSGYNKSKRIESF